ncbi:DUF4865 domain-containing protein [Gilliamella sp. wkB108]|uniref:DUF4865 family protein n=1 Tax=Gilliamella sp. wkB108 TaxID=3120256 RepID=UPI00080E9F93|nr:DUF4865 family protein [Gilliamella apicola]OCG23482.1 DUF4865 domain-containing protein [Gilliamella apicola]
MQAMQYKINLPADYDMQIIKNRIKQNGYKTDRFEDLLFKAYLISEKDNDNLANSYCPLYVWRQTTGMTKFIFDGYFDNIIDSFGWQNINIGVTSNVELSESFSQSRYVLAQEVNIPTQVPLKDFCFKNVQYPDELANVVIYNPDKWQYVTFTFFKERPTTTKHNLYTVLHLSLG